jgi:hypothetical protein
MAGRHSSRGDGAGTHAHPVPGGSMRPMPVQILRPAAIAHHEIAGWLSVERAAPTLQLPAVSRSPTTFPEMEVRHVRFSGTTGS